VLLDRTVLAAGPTTEVFTEANLRRAFGGGLRSHALPTDAGQGTTTLLFDDEHPFILHDRNGDA